MKRIMSLFLILIGCQLMMSECLAQESNDNGPSYKAELRAWHQKRLNRLKAPDGWLSLAGLFWIEEGRSTFGSSDDNDLRFPEPSPAQIGTFNRVGDSIWMEVKPGILVQIDSKPVTRILMFKSGQDVPVAELGDMNWLIMKRGDRYALRLRNRSNPKIFKLDTLPYYPINMDWRVEASFHPADSGFSILLDDVQGMKRQYFPEGILKFAVQGKEHEMLVLDGGRDQYFLIFGDATNGVETYGGGRYVYTDRADKNGKTTIDFNKAYNPPCAFTDYATCLLPAPQNKLNILIEAGELNYRDH